MAKKPSPEIPPDPIEPFFHLRKDAGLIISIPVRDEQGRFHIWFREGEGWRRMQPFDLAESDYFSKAPAKDADLSFSFVHFMLQHCRNLRALKVYEGVRNDMHNLGACFRKLELYHEEGRRGAADTRRFVVTEIEYMVGVCRSLFDLHQRIAKELWDSVTILDPAAKARKRCLPASFADVALSGDAARSAEELSARYGLGSQWAAFYPAEADFFRKLRKFRNDIEHGGLTPEIIFTTSKGFAVNETSTPFAQFGVWREETFLPNRLAPVKPVLAFIVGQTFASMGRFVQALAQEIRFEAEIAPGYRVFMRGHYLDRLARLNEYIQSDPWYPELAEAPKQAP